MPLKVHSLTTRLWTLSIVAALLIVTALPAKADVTIAKPEYEGLLRIDIEGTLVESYATKFENILRETEFQTLVVRLDSRGGDVAAAIKIGRLIRKYEGATWTAVDAPRDVRARRPPHDRCYSSCALIFIADVHRDNDGEIGLHRPYLSTAPQSREIIAKEVPRMLAVVKSYVAEMGITDNFYQQMVNTDPSKIMIYNKDDIRELIPATDATYDETRVAYAARRYGATTSEIRQRETEAEGCISKSHDSNMFLPNCGEAIKYGLNESAYNERRAKSEKACWFSDKKEYSDDEMAIINKTQLTLMWDLPFVIKRESCVRSIMLGR